jgi:hypothetical protein
MSRPGYVDKRGSNADRARRRSWLLATFDEDLGPGRARCRLKLSPRCERIVDEVNLAVDRIEMGGSYRRTNIQPSCRTCSDRQGGLAGIATQDELLAEYRAARDQWEIEFDLKTGRTYRPGIIAEARAKSRRGGRNEVTDYVDEYPPPVLSEWLEEWHGARREQAS